MVNQLMIASNFTMNIDFSVLFY